MKIARGASTRRAATGTRSISSTSGENCQDDGVNIMLCHKSNALPKEERIDVPCQGWIRVMGFDAIGVRLLVMRGQVTCEEVEDRDGPRLFPTFTAMLRANKIKLPRRSRMKP